ncbi:unnamed protein product [Caenorhabditis brenneri]
MGYFNPVLLDSREEHDLYLFDGSATTQVGKPNLRQRPSPVGIYVVMHTVPYCINEEHSWELGDAWIVIGVMLDIDEQKIQLTMHFGESDSCPTSPGLSKMPKLYCCMMMFVCDLKKQKWVPVSRVPSSDSSSR